MYAVNCCSSHSSNTTISLSIFFCLPLHIWIYLCACERVLSLIIIIFIIVYKTHTRTTLRPTYSRLAHVFIQTSQNLCVLSIKIAICMWIYLFIATTKAAAAEKSTFAFETIGHALSLCKHVCPLILCVVCLFVCCCVNNKDLSLIGICIKVVGFGDADLENDRLHE